MSIPAIIPASIPAPAIMPSLEGKLAERNVTAIVLFGGITSTVMIIAAAVVMQFSLLIAGFAMVGFTALASILAYRHNIRVLKSEFIAETNFLQHQINEIGKEAQDLQEEINELKENQITPSDLMGRLAVLEKEFLNRGRYKYIDETPGEDDVPVPSSASSSASSSSSPKSPGLSTESLPK